MTETKLRVASAQYAIEYFGDWQALKAKLASWVEEGAAAGARLLVFPEYAALELVGIASRRSRERRSPDRHQLGPLPVQEDRRVQDSLLWATDAIQPLIPDYRILLSELAVRHGVYILAGSVPVRHSDGSLTNTAYFFTATGGIGTQDKMVLTRWEREIWNMRRGDEVRVFETEFGPIGVAICYDVEFPVIARRQAEAQARVILAPCCCDSLRGYYRVRVGARARALENQAYVVQSPAVGTTSWLGAIDRCAGFAGIYAPPDLGPRENGVVAQGELGRPGWIYADLDLGALDRIRGGRGVLANAPEWNAHMLVGPAVRVDTRLPAKNRRTA
jgi:predicted amidohydrolase